MLFTEHGNDCGNYYIEACRNYELGNYEQACYYFELVFRHNKIPDHQAPSLYWQYSTSLFKVGECEKALSIAERGLSYHPDIYQLFDLRGRIYFELGLLSLSRNDFLKSVTLFANLSERNGDGPILAYWYLSVIAARQEKTEESLEYLALFVSEKPAYRYIQKLCRSLLNLGMDDKLLSESLVKIGLSTLSAYRLVSQIQSNLTWEESTLPEDNELGQWAQFHLHHGNYQALHDCVDKYPGLSTGDARLLPYLCIARWLEAPRQSAAELLSVANADRAEIQACILVEKLIFEKSCPAIDKNSEAAAELVNISLMLYEMGDICLAIDIGIVLLGAALEEYCARLGRYFLRTGCYRAARVLLERSLSGEERYAEIYCELGIACIQLGCYEQALEYFWQSMALDPKNRIYPCLTFEALARQERRLLVQRFDLLERSQELKKELLRLCSIQYKSMRLRQQLTKEEKESRQGRIDGDDYDLSSLFAHTVGEELWDVYA